ncbi:hypothetical protein HC251_04645 [Iamia sp. SCSIO 61187]|uniref:hypothetical protein n=1 Tax=Iamia sp. SCSIO 61187 TaxID=2722752 RepID=UPI001C631504|nr:hypothetical protein [Iamia sp. SCSIO 61187]QYG91799.1 hypothetical protein HC251_04645 [Iamia sp. SCSIO 61187]
MDATWGRGAIDSAWDAAVELAELVAHGSPLPALPSTVLLDPGEMLHADVAAVGWRFQAMDVFYEEPRILAIGGPVLFAAASIGAASARRRARAEAERLAAPQWRSLGRLRVLATDLRLLVWFEGAWASVWYDGIRELHPDLEQHRVTMLFDDDPPYALAGPWLPYLTVILTACLAARRGTEAVAAALGANP